MEFSVVIPVYNEEESLALFQERLHKVMEKLSREYEIIYINDGSDDSSLEILRELKSSYPKIKIIVLEKNYGQSSALHAGFKNLLGKWVITLDADLQDPPEEIFKLLKHQDDFDFIIGIREKRKHGIQRIILAGIAMCLRRLILGDRTRDVGCSLRVFRGEVLDSVCFFKNFHLFLPFMARRKGYSVKEVKVAHHQRKYGKSKYGVFKIAKEGIFDLFGVLWLKSRYLDYKVKDKT